MITKAVSLEQAQQGIQLIFSQPVGLRPQNIYTIDFKLPIVLPNKEQASITFVPTVPSYTVTGAVSAPRTFLKIVTSKKIQIKVVVQLIITDSSNAIVYTDYITVVCNPSNNRKSWLMFRFDALI